MTSSRLGIAGLVGLMLLLAAASHADLSPAATPLLLRHTQQSPLRPLLGFLDRRHTPPAAPAHSLL